MKITTEFLKSIDARQSIIDQVAKYENKELVAVIRQLVDDDHWHWANWLIVQIMDYKQYVNYAVFAAMQVIDIYEKEYQDDKRPRLAIKAAQKCIDDPSVKNKRAAMVAAKAAARAADAVREADAANAAWAAAWAANAAGLANSAWAAAVVRAAKAAVKAADAAAEVAAKIIEYGILLLKNND